MKEIDETLGCLGLGESDKDYVLCEWDIDLLPTLYDKDEIRFEYNQYKYKWSYVSCTIFGAVWALSDLTNYQFSYDEIKDIDDTSYDNPNYTHIRRRWEWWWTKDAVEHIAKWWNSHPELVKKYWKVAYYRISKYSDSIIEDALDKLYTLVWNYHPTSSYNQDKADWMLDGADFWTQTSWHAVDIIKKEWQRSVKDSGSVPEKNIYWLKHKLSEITNYWQYFYIYTLVREDAYEEIKRLNEIKAECNLLIEHLWKLWHLVNDKNFQWVLHYIANRLRNKINDCNEELKKYI